MEINSPCCRMGRMVPAACAPATPPPFADPPPLPRPLPVVQDPHMPGDLQRMAAKSLHRLADSCLVTERPPLDEMAPPEPKNSSEVHCGGPLAVQCARHVHCQACYVYCHTCRVLILCLRLLAPTPVQVILGGAYVNCPKMSDIKFIVEGRPFHAHRIALLSSSEIFKTMFEGEVAAGALQAPLCRACGWGSKGCRDAGISCTAPCRVLPRAECWPPAALCTSPLQATTARRTPPPSPSPTSVGRCLRR